jgi:crotonobetainyl-CoA:carnitine CoA-transferase CaiB-like acyl-CoA transferase
VLARDRFMPRLKALFAAMPRERVLAECERIGLPFAPINRPEDMFDDPHLNHPGALLPITVPGGGAARAPALPLEIDGARPGLTRDIPLAGQHSAELCREIGMTEDEIAVLIETGCITGGPG